MVYALETVADKDPPSLDLGSDLSKSFPKSQVKRHLSTPWIMQIHTQTHARLFLAFGCLQGWWCVICMDKYFFPKIWKSAVECTWVRGWLTAALGHGKCGKYWPNSQHEQSVPEKVSFSTQSDSIPALSPELELSSVFPDLSTSSRAQLPSWWGSKPAPKPTQMWPIHSVV